MNKIMALLTICFGTLVAAGDATAYTARVRSACKTDFYEVLPVL